MSEAHTYTCDNCESTAVASNLPDNWDWVNISSMRTNYRQTMHLCSGCMGSMRISRGKVLIQRLIGLVARVRGEAG